MNSEENYSKKKTRLLPRLSFAFSLPFEIFVKPISENTNNRFLAAHIGGYDSPFHDMSMCQLPLGCLLLLAI